MPAAKQKENSPFLQYKGKPLVRSGNTIYYGEPGEKYVVMLQILTTRQENGEERPGKVSVSLLSTDETVKPKDRIAKKSEKESLYTALDIGIVWLERALKDA